MHVVFFVGQHQVIKKRRKNMSGDHSETTIYGKELLIDAGFEQVENTTLYKKANLYLLSPAVKKINREHIGLMYVRRSLIDVMMMTVTFLFL